MPTRSLGIYCNVSLGMVSDRFRMSQQLQPHAHCAEIDRSMQWRIAHFACAGPSGRSTAKQFQAPSVERRDLTAWMSVRRFA